MMRKTIFPLVLLVMVLLIGWPASNSIAVEQNTIMENPRQQHVGGVERQPNIGFIEEGSIAIFCQESINLINNNIITNIDSYLEAFALPGHKPVRMNLKFPIASGSDTILFIYDSIRQNSISRISMDVTAGCDEVINNQTISLCESMSDGNIESVQLLRERTVLKLSYFRART